jgi:hypothetical protein
VGFLLEIVHLICQSTGGKHRSTYMTQGLHMCEREKERGRSILIVLTIVCTQNNCGIEILEKASLAKPSRPNQA